MQENLLKPTELGFADFVSQLISETLQSVVTSMIQQEKQIQELENEAMLSIDNFAERLDGDLVRKEILQLFPSDENEKSSVDANAPYIPSNKDTLENPPIYSIIKYKMMPEKDFNRGEKGLVITEEGYKHIYDAVKILLATQYKGAMTNIISRGVPRVVVDHGKINSKINIYLRAEGKKETKSIHKKQMIRPFLPTLMAQPINNKSPEFLGLNVNIIGEVEVTFKTISV